MAEEAPRYIERRGSVAGTAATAAVVLACVIAALFFLPELSDSQRDLLRFLIAVGSGAFATFFLGGVAMEGTVGNFRIAAGGGFALFLIMLLLVDPLPPRSDESSNGSNIPQAEARSAPPEVSVAVLRKTVKEALAGNLTDETKINATAAAVGVNPGVDAAETMRLIMLEMLKDSTLQGSKNFAARVQSVL